MIDYTCTDCGCDFCSNENEPVCPNCSSMLFDTVADLGLLYIIGDWFDLWGKD